MITVPADDEMEEFPQKPHSQHEVEGASAPLASLPTPRVARTSSEVPAPHQIPSITVEQVSRTPSALPICLPIPRNPMNYSALPSPLGGKGIPRAPCEADESMTRISSAVKASLASLLATSLPNKRVRSAVGD